MTTRKLHSIKPAYMFLVICICIFNLCLSSCLCVYIYCENIPPEFGAGLETGDISEHKIWNMIEALSDRKTEDNFKFCAEYRGMVPKAKEVFSGNWSD